MEEKAPLPLSRAAQYGVRVLTHLARLPSGDSATIATIAEAQSLPKAFLAKVVRQLVRTGLIESYRGPGGGIRPARPPSQITVLEVIEGAGDLRFLQVCFLGLPECDDDHPCVLHEFWTDARQRLRSALSRTTIAELAQGER